MSRFVVLIILCLPIIIVSCGESNLSPGVWFNFTTSDGLPSNIVYEADEAPDGTIWLATYAGVSHYLANDSFVNLTTADGLPSDFVLCVACGDDGKVWMGTNQGLAVYDGNSFVTYTTGDGLPSDEINTIALEDATTAWVGTDDGGICRFCPGVSAEIYDISNSDLPANQVWDLAFGDDKVIIATSEGGAIFIPPGNWQVFTVGDGLLNDQVFSVYPLGNDIWFGTAGGVSVYDGSSFTNYTTANSGLTNSSVSGICADSDGNPVWIATLNGGVNRLDNGSDWSAYGPGYQPGPNTLQINSAMCTSANIKWFPTNGGGVSRYSPPAQ